MSGRIQLSLKENVFLAKKSIIKNIYNSAKIEGCDITFPQIQTILDGVSVGGISVDDIQCVLNLRDAWKYVLTHVEIPVNLEQLKKINRYFIKNESLDWGVLRSGQVGISGVNYIPPIPEEKEVEHKIEELLQKPEPTDRAIQLMLWAMRAQLFWDGNKRTSMLAANQVLIQNGAGVLTVNEENLEEFNVKLSAYYETNDTKQIVSFFKEKCLFGIERIR